MEFHVLKIQFLYFFVHRETSHLPLEGKKNVLQYYDHTESNFYTKFDLEN